MVVATRASRSISLLPISSRLRKRPLHLQQSQQQQRPPLREAKRALKQLKEAQTVPKLKQLKDTKKKLEEPSSKPDDDHELLKEAQDAQKLDLDHEQCRESEATAAPQVPHHEEQKCQENELHPPSALSPYETFRLQRIAENRARMAALGVDKHAATLTSFFKATKARTPTKGKRQSPAKTGSPDLLRRSERLRNIPAPPTDVYLEVTNEGFGKELSGLTKVVDCVKAPKRRRQDDSEASVRKKTYRNRTDVDNVRPANAPIPKNCPADLKISAELSEYRCKSKERGTLYDAIVGICCHFCRQKKLCGEENCQRCGERDVSKPCLGKTDCSKCHSSRGVFCRACLKIRYGEEIDDVWQKDDWLCPHCSEEQGLNPFWICNSSICLTRRKIAPTGIAIYKARDLGFKSVAHYLADILEKQA